MKRPRIIAIGDIHGCLTHLEKLIDILRPSPSDYIIFLGDYIDRGPDIPGTIAYLRAFEDEFPLTTFLRGNHEAMLLDVLSTHPGRYGDAYLKESNGGYVTLQQYGASPAEVEAFRKGNLSLYDAQKLFASYIPEDDMCFLWLTKLYHMHRDYLFVHAGINPEKSLAEQSDDDFMWIRKPFLTQPHSLNYTIIYGHTPTRECNYTPRVELEKRRIGIDTGAIYGGALCAVTLPEMSFTFYPSMENAPAVT